MTKVRILLRQECRNPEGLRTAREGIEALGMKLPVVGAVTVSAEIEPGAFESLFGQKVERIPARPPSREGFGRSGGSVSGVLPGKGAPELLKDADGKKFVDGIAVKKINRNLAA